MRNSSKPSISIIQKALFLRDFSEFEMEMDKLSRQEKFIEILNEYYLCEMKIEDLQRTERMVESYRKLQKELKIELINYLNKSSFEKGKNSKE